MGDIIIATLSNDRLRDIEQTRHLKKLLVNAASDAGVLNKSTEVCSGFSVIARFSGDESRLFLTTGGDTLAVGRDKLDLSRVKDLEREVLLDQVRALAKVLDHYLIPVDTGR